ncbi:MAG: hypothetical protein PVI30_18310 [Myxococcales bacterium]|jgi:hypothetical protein
MLAVMPRIAPSLALSLALLVAPPMVGAGRAQAPDRHMGVQLRATAGPGLLTSTQDVGDGQSSEISGLALGFGFALGTMVTDHLAINMDLALARAGSADYDVLQDAVFTAVHLGAGVTYWLMPENIFLAASVGAARSSVSGEPIRIDVELPNSESTHVGLGVHLTLGKQWWVSRRWGLGASLGILGSSAANPAVGRDTNRVTVGLIAALTATFH